MNREANPGSSKHTVKKDYEKAQKQVNALEEEAVKAITGESQLDLKVVNAMLLKHREKLEAAQREMEETRNLVAHEDQNNEPCHHVYVPSAYQSSWTFGTVRSPHMVGTTNHFVHQHKPGTFVFKGVSHQDALAKSI